MSYYNYPDKLCEDQSKALMRHICGLIADGAEVEKITIDHKTMPLDDTEGATARDLELCALLHGSEWLEEYHDIDGLPAILTKQAI